MENNLWFRMSLPEVYEKTRSSGSGLTQKEARRRRVRGGGLLERPKEKLSSVILRSLSDFSPVLLILVAILAIIMEQGEGARLIIILTAIYLVTAIFLSARSGHIIEGMCGRRAPRVQVIRDGKVYFISASAVAQGDVVLLSEGDIVPADCRIISASDLFAHEGGVTANGFSVPKFAAPDDISAVRTPERMSNMLFALSKITHGSARAIAVSVGDDCYVVKTRGREALPYTGDLRAFRSLEKIARTSGLVIPAFSFVLMLLDIFLPSSHESAYSTFLWGFSLCTASVGALYPLIGRMAASQALRRAAGRKTGAVISDLSALEKSGGTDVLLFPVESAVLTEKFKVTSLYYDNTEHDTERPDEGGQALLARASAVLGAIEALPSLSFGASAKDPVLRAVADKAIAEGADSRLFPVAEAVPKGAGSRFITGLICRNGEYTACSVGQATEILSACTGCIMHGELAVMTPVIYAHACEIIKNAQESAKTVIAVAERRTGYNSLRFLQALQSELSLVGFITVEQTVSDGFERASELLRDGGIDLFPMTGEGGEQTEAKNLLISLGFAGNGGDILTGAEIAAMNDRELTERITAYKGAVCVGGEERARVVSALLRAGKHPAYMGAATCDAAALNVAPLGIACADIEKKKRREVKSRDTDAYGSQLLKLISDVTVRRADAESGGLLSVAETLRCAAGFYSNMNRAVRYLVASHWLRLVLAALAVCLRVTAVTPTQILITGPLADLFAVFAICSRSADDGIPTSGRKSLPGSYKALFTSVFPVCLAAGCLSLLIPYIVSFFGAFETASLPASVFSSVLLCQLGIFAYYSCRRSVFLPSEWRGGIPTGMFYLSVVLFIFICVLWGSFGTFFSLYPVSAHDMIYSFITPAGLFIYLEAKKLIGGAETEAEAEPETDGESGNENKKGSGNAAKK